MQLGDQILDFVRGDDLIDLSGIDARSGAGNQDFTFIGTATFGGHKGELRYEKFGANAVIVSGDIDGDARADFKLLVKGVTALDAGDLDL